LVYLVDASALEVLSGISPVVSSGHRPDSAPSKDGSQRSAADPPRAPSLPTPHNPFAPAPTPSAPGGVGGGAGPSPLGVLATLFAFLALAGILGGVLPVSVAALQPADFAFHLTRPG
jgi:hypothetical protein